jgi:tRNA wybutosine-synthesizing protein 3
MAIFVKRKKDRLLRRDKSFRGSWDNGIINLCSKINSSDGYYTTSSCSGRALFLRESEKKEKNLFLRVYHDELSFNQIKKDVLEIVKEFRNEKEIVKFKQESPILHVGCRNLELAQNLLNKAKTAGWKKSGIISSEGKFFVELCSTEKLEFPVIKDGNLLVGDKFWMVVVKEANKRLEKYQEKIKKLEELID